LGLSLILTQASVGFLLYDSVFFSSTKNRDQKDLGKKTKKREKNAEQAFFLLPQTKTKLWHYNKLTQTTEKMTICFFILQCDLLW